MILFLNDFVKDFFIMVSIEWIVYFRFLCMLIFKDFYVIFMLWFEEIEWVVGFVCFVLWCLVLLVNLKCFQFLCYFFVIDVIFVEIVEYIFVSFGMQFVYVILYFDLNIFFYCYYKVICMLFGVMLYEYVKIRLIIVEIL